MSSPQSFDAPAIRLTVDLPVASVLQLSRIAQGDGSTLTQALQRALVTELRLLRHRQAGARVLLEAPDGALRELVFCR